MALAEYGWRRTASGRWVHPDMPPLDGGRRRVFTEGEALTLTAAFIPDGVCEECGSVHDETEVGA